jgi:SAM-dependent methyltransferase
MINLVKGNPDSKYAGQLRQHYAPLALEHGDSFRAVDWGSEAGQNKRFEVLLGCVDFRHLRILDVGCGVGHLVVYLKEHGFDGSYLGIDLVPEMIDKAKLNNSDFNFQVVKSLEDVESFKPDLVIASGLFTFADNLRFQATISQLFRLTSHALAFNSLSAWKESQQHNEFYADPIAAFSYCASLTKKIVFRHDYMSHDFSFYLYK